MSLGSAYSSGPFGNFKFKVSAVLFSTFDVLSAHSVRTDPLKVLCPTFRGSFGKLVALWEVAVWGVGMKTSVRR